MIPWQPSLKLYTSTKNPSNWHSDTDFYPFGLMVAHLKMKPFEMQICFEDDALFLSENISCQWPYLNILNHFGKVMDYFTACLHTHTHTHTHTGTHSHMHTHSDVYTLEMTRRQHSFVSLLLVFVFNKKFLLSSIFTFFHTSNKKYAPQFHSY